MYEGIKSPKAGMLENDSKSYHLERVYMVKSG